MDPKNGEDGNTGSPASSLSGKRFWTVILMLDTIFIFIFGGALTGMIWLQHPSAATSSSIRPATATKAQPKIAAVPSQEVSAPPDPSFPAETPRDGTKAPTPAKAVPAPAKEQREKKLDPAKLPAGSPGVAAPELPRRQAQPATPAGGTDPSQTAARPAQSDNAAPSTDRPKAKPVEFTCRAKEAKEVLLKGPFLVRTGGVKQMNKDSDAAWHTTVSLLPGTYKYYCVVNGRKSKPATVTVP